MSAKPNDIFVFFNEIGIINQLSSHRFERSLPDGLTLSQFSVLNNFARLGGTRTPAQLAKAFQVTKGAMTNTLNRLKDRGAIKITDDPDDGRRKVVSITRAGLALRERAVKASGEAVEEILPLLDTEWMQDVIPKLQELRATLDKARDI